MPSIAITRLYEAVYIVDPDLGEEQVEAITSRYRQIVETAGGTVGSVDVWERRKLAYEIKGRREGIYVVMHFTGTAIVEAELRRVFQISEDQIRSMIVRMDEEEPAALPAAETPPAAQAAPAPVAEAPAPEASTPDAPAEETASVPDAEPAAA